MNLLSNAVKYSARVGAPRIEVTGRAAAEMVLFGVRDNGVGFDMTQSTKLFSLFQRLHSSSEYAGTGVGLAIAQRIVKRHRGDIWATSEKGRGALFEFSLPYTASPI
jgi:signal transduction histidine kinase